MRLQVNKYKEQKTVLIEATKRLKLNLESSEEKVKDLSQQVSKLSKQVNQLTKSTAEEIANSKKSMEQSISALNDQIRFLQKGHFEKAHMILTNLYSFVKAVRYLHYQSIVSPL